MRRIQMLIPAFFSAVAFFILPVQHATGVEYQFVLLAPPGMTDSIALGGQGTSSQAGLGASTAGAYHALLWNGTAAGVVDLHPPGFDTTQAHAIAGGVQVGAGFLSVGGETRTRGLLWTGSAASAVNMHPGSDWISSSVNGTDGIRHFGDGVFESPRQLRALLWTGTNPIPVDFHPAGYTSSQGAAISGNQMVGIGGGSGTGPNALLWNGTPDSVVNLHPPGATMSIGRDIASGEQVGDVFPTPSSFRAALWRGSADSFVDLHPAGFDNSSAEGTNGQSQVGYARRGTIDHAIVWSGTSQSAVDLHSFVPAQFTRSEARAIDEFGNIFGAAYTNFNERRAAMWVVVPEPGTFAAAALSTLCLARRLRSFVSLE